MKMLCSFVSRLLSDARFVCAGILFVSVFSLGSALTAEYVFGLKPCILCLYQRVPYVLTALLALAGLVFAFKKPRISGLLSALCGIVFLGGFWVAFFHVGVEQHWWTSPLPGCGVDSLKGTPEDALSQIMNSEVVRCDEIPWSLFGLSMAAYNTVFSFFLALGCLLCAALVRKRAAS